MFIKAAICWKSWESIDNGDAYDNQVWLALDRWINIDKFFSNIDYDWLALRWQCIKYGKVFTASTKG